MTRFATGKTHGARGGVALLVSLALLVSGCAKKPGPAPSASSRALSVESAAASPSASAVASSSASARLLPLAPSLLAPDPEGVARLEHDVGYLASDALAGRLTGEPGARLAAELVEKRFGEAGLAPFGDPLSEGNAGAKRGFDYRFSPFPNAKVEPPTMSIAVRDTSVDAGPTVRSSEVAVSALRTVDGSASGTVSGGAVFVGFGITTPGWDDYGGSDVAGKIAVALRGAPKIANHTPRELFHLATFRRKIHTALAHHAAGLVVISRTDELPLTTIDPKGAGLPALVVKRSASLELVPGSPAEQAKRWTTTEPGAPVPMPHVEVSLSTRVAPLDRWSNDVVGLLPAYDGSPTADEWVVLGAHYDHVGMGGRNLSMAPWLRAIHPGADDNASGTALLCEVARRLAALPRRPARNVLFLAFAGEELGLLGSRAWVDDPPVPLDHVVAMVNADMVGRLRKNTLTVENTKTSHAWTDLFTEANRGIGLGLDFPSSDALVDRSDHGSFDLEHVPAVLLFTGLHPDYHRPSDTADKVNVDGLERISTLAARVVLELAEHGMQR